MQRFGIMVTDISKGRCVWYSRYLGWNLRGGISKPNGCASLGVLFPVEQKSMLLRFICSCSAPTPGMEIVSMYPHKMKSHKIKLDILAQIKWNSGDLWKYSSIDISHDGSRYFTLDNQRQSSHLVAPLLLVQGVQGSTCSAAAQNRADSSSYLQPALQWARHRPAR